MRKWIANLFRRLRRPATKEKDLPCVYSVSEDNVRVDVLESLLPCGHCGYIIRAEFFVEEYGEWLKIADLRDFNVATALTLLDRAKGFVASMEHGLVTAR